VDQAFDRRIVSAELVALLRACHASVPFHLGGGAALAGVHLRHRLSRDVDLFVHDRTAHRELVRAFTDAAKDAGLDATIIRDGGTFVRAVPDIEAPPPAVEGVVVESLADLRANKVTCILSRSEPRDLVDLLFLDRAGYPPEADLPLALRKDAGVDPGVLAWLLRDFPVSPLPVMLIPLDEDTLRTFRDDLRERLRRLAVPEP
jgi:hypothetical protein